MRGRLFAWLNHRMSVRTAHSYGGLYSAAAHGGRQPAAVFGGRLAPVGASLPALPGRSIPERNVDMRLDKYLKVSRLIKRRTVANDACDAGRVTVNGKPARASYEVKEGDELGITLGAREVRVRVVSVQETVAKNDAALLYQVLE